MKTQIAILGGGVGGLCLLYELTNQNYDCILIQHGEIGSHASAHNQRWLHSGSFFAATRQEDVAKACFYNSRKLKMFCADHRIKGLAKPAGCLFLFSRMRSAEISWKEMQRVLPDLTMKFLTNKSSIKAREPKINAELFEAGILVEDDCLFDPSPVLRYLAESCMRRTGKQIFQSSKQVSELDVKRDDDRWVVTDKETTIEAQVLVSAAGVTNPTVISKINGRAFAHSFERTDMAVLDQPVCRGLVLMDLARLLTPMGDKTLFNVSPGFRESNYTTRDRVSENTTGRLVTRLSKYLTGLLESKIGFYTCHKLNNSDDELNLISNGLGERHFFWTREETAGLYSFYPGLFTTALGASQQLAAELKQAFAAGVQTVSNRSLDEHDSPIAFKISEMSVAYTHQLRFDGGTWHLDILQ